MNNRLAYSFARPTAEEEEEEEEEAAGFLEEVFAHSVDACLFPIISYHTGTVFVDKLLHT